MNMAELDQTSMLLFKRCSKCRGEKPTSEFHKDRSKVDGLCNQCKICRREYEHSAERMIATLHRVRRYKQTEKCKVTKLEYRISGRQSMAIRINYHRIQDEYGCHSTPRYWLPAARFLEGLQTAEVVEIKA